jgi:hypothetical protein
MNRRLQKHSKYYLRVTHEMEMSNLKMMPAFVERLL